MHRADQPARTRPSEKQAILSNERLKIDAESKYTVKIKVGDKEVDEEIELDTEKQRP